MSRIAEQVRELALPIAAELGLEIMEVEFLKEGGQQILRVTLDSPAGITHADCEAVSRRLDALLDAQELVESAYALEVSSPGAERPLRSDRDFARFAGRRVLVKTYASLDGERQFLGELVGGDAHSFTVTVEGHDRTFSRDQVALVRLTLD